MMFTRKLPRFTADEERVRLRAFFHAMDYAHMPVYVLGFRVMLDEGRPLREILADHYGKPCFMLRMQWSARTIANIRYGELFGSRRTWLWRADFTADGAVVKITLLREYDARWRQRLKEALRQWARFLQEE